MPLYATSCAHCATAGTIFRHVANRDDLPLCVCGGPLVRVLSAPFVRPDITPYESPLTPGKAINSREQRYQEMSRAGKMDWEPGLKQDILRRQAENIEKACVVADKAIDVTVRELTASGHLET